MKKNNVLLCIKKLYIELKKLTSFLEKTGELFEESWRAFFDTTKPDNKKKI